MELSNNILENGFNKNLNSFNLKRTIFEILLSRNEAVKRSEVKDLLENDYGLAPHKYTPVLIHVINSENFGAYQIESFSRNNEVYFISPQKDIRLLKMEQYAKRDPIFKAIFEVLKENDTPLSYTQIYEMFISKVGKSMPGSGTGSVYTKIVKYERLGFLNCIFLRNQRKAVLYYLPKKDGQIINFPYGCEKDKPLEERIIAILNVFHIPLETQQIIEVLKYQDPDFSMSESDFSGVLQKIRKTKAIKTRRLMNRSLWSTANGQRRKIQNSLKLKQVILK